jgi:hypothetical protein
MVWAHTRMVAPGKTWINEGEPYFSLPQNFPSEMWDDITKGKGRAIYWGRMRYRDLIQNPVSINALEIPDPKNIHETCFCYFWSPRFGWVSYHWPTRIQQAHMRST